MFELFVRPLLNKMMGDAQPVRKERRPLVVSYRRKKAARVSWIPVNIDEDGVVFPLEYHGSAHISALTQANGLMAIPRGIQELKKGDLVDVRQI